MQDEAAAPVGVGVIGLGGVSQLRHLPALAAARAAGKVRLVAVCDVEPSRAAAAAAEWAVPGHTTDEAELLAEPVLDAVVIATPNRLHYRQVMAALAAGKHVLCEKPLALTLAEARTMTETARRAGLVTAINFRYRWIPAVLYVSDLLASGALGRLYRGIFHYYSGWLADPATPGSWRTVRAESGSGALGDLGSHLIDLAGHWLGAPCRVRGELTTFVTERPVETDRFSPVETDRFSPVETDRFSPVDVDDAASFSIEYAGGAHGQFLATRCAMGFTNCQRISLFGSLGSVSYEFDRWDRGGERVQLCLGAAQARQAGLAPWPVGPEHLKGVPTGPIEEFIAAVRAGRSARPSFEDGLQCQEVLTAIQQSAVTGRVVELPLG